MTVRSRVQLRVYVYDVDTLAKPTSDSLVIGHSTRGKIGATAANKLRNHPSGYMLPTDISCDVLSVRVSRGRQSILDSAAAGRCTIELDATDRRFDPLFTTGAYGVVGRQRFRRMAPIVVAVTGLTRDNGTVSTQEFPLFSGWIDDVDFGYAPTGTLFSATVTCMDAFGLMSTVDLNATDLTYGSGETMGPRVRRWAEVAGVTGALANDANNPPDTNWTTTFRAGPDERGRYGLVELDTGSFPLAATNLSANALTAVKAAAASNDGAVWALANGALAWKSWPVSPTSPTTVFSDASGGAASAELGGEMFAMSDLLCPFADARPRQDRQAFANVVRLARAGGVEQVGVAPTIDADGRVELNRTDFLNNSDPDVKTLADRLALRHGGRPPVTVSFTTHPFAHDAALIRACNFELNEFARWEWTQVGMSVPGVVVAIEHDIRPGSREWRQTWTVTEWTGAFSA